MHISVVIPAYNAIETIKRAILSCLSQTHLPTEIIVVDNNSTDGTSSFVLKEFNNTQVPVILISEQKKGANYCRNKGLFVAKGELVQFLDADDELLESKFEAQSKLVQENSYDVVTGGFYQMKNLGKVDKTIPLSYDIETLLFKSEFGKTSTLLFKRDRLLAVGGWDDNVLSSQEYELLFRLYRNHSTFGIFTGMVARIHESGTSRISVLNEKANAIRFFELRVKMLDEFDKREAIQMNNRNEIYTSFYNAILTVYNFDRLIASNYFNTHLRKKIQFLNPKTRWHARLKFGISL